MAEREYNFGPGNPDPGVFPAEELGAAAQRVLNRLGTELAHYPDPLGLPELRAVAAERFERNQGIGPALEDIVITNGAMQSLVLSAQGLARPGDSVVMEEFEYGGTIRVFKQHGLKLVGVALDDEGMRMDALERVLARSVAQAGLHLHHVELSEPDRDHAAARASRAPARAGAAVRPADRRGRYLRRHRATSRSQRRPSTPTPGRAR